MGFPRLLAIGFVTPLWLWGLGGIAIPIAIHLWRRQTPRVERWAAMQFLQAALARQAHRLRWESLLLLCVRCLAVVLLVMAVSEPFLERITPVVSGAGRTHRILLLDGSLSMSAKIGVQTAFERARSQAREIVRQSQTGDTFQLCRIGSAVPPVIIRRPAHDPADVLREIDRLAVLDDQGDVTEALRGVREILSNIPIGQTTEIFILSDFQTTNWSGDSPADEAQQRLLLRELAAKASLFLVNSGTTSVTNVAIHSVSAPENVALSGQPLLLEVKLRNYSHLTETRTLEILANQTVRSSQSVTLGPESQQQLSVEVSLPESEVPVAIEARIAADAITSDNQWQRVVASRRSLDLLLVDSHPSESLMDSSTGFVQLALAPPLANESPHRARFSPFQTKTCSVAEMTMIDFSHYDGLILSDVSGLDENQVQRLVEYVEQGGGLIIGWGDRTDRDEFQRTLGAKLAPIDVLDVSDHREEPVTFETRDLSHPVLTPFRGRVDAGFSSAPLSRYARIKPHPAANWQVILPLTNGDPVLLERSIGRGRIILVTTSLDDSWGHWVVWPSFVPLINRLVEYSLEGRLRFDPLTCGMPLLKAYQQPVTGQVRLPTMKSTEALVETQGAQTILSWPSTGLAGIYQINPREPNLLPTLFAVNPDPRESDPRSLSLEALRRGLLAETPFEWINDVKSISRPDPSAASGRSPLARPLLWVALGLLMTEQILASSFRWGVVALMGTFLGGAVIWWSG